MTYSIVARDRETGELGVAVQTGTFGVGRVVQWARPNVGAVATQSFSEKSYGPLGLELMAAGKSAEQALTALVAADPGEAFRQVAMVDASGGAAVHTGSGCVRAAGHHVGDGWSVQANMMASERVWPAMAEAYETAAGTLARRLLAALDAAEAAGGDFRARQSAALLVVPAGPDALPWSVVSDLRVDDHPQPLAELRRLLTMEEAYRMLSSPETASPEAAAPLREKDRILYAALGAAHAGDPDEARRLLQPLFAAHPHWRDTVRAYGENGLFPGWEQVLAAGEARRSS